jgi:hypothetical protein
MYTQILREKDIPSTLIENIATIDIDIYEYIYIYMYMYITLNICIRRF